MAADLAEIQRAAKVGTTIKLKDYSRYTDYSNHDGQTAVIYRINTMGDAYNPVSIRWSDGITSSVRFSNIIIINGDWDV